MLTLAVATWVRRASTFTLASYRLRVDLAALAAALPAAELTSRRRACCEIFGRASFR